MSTDVKPTGREAVIEALIDATAKLIVEQGTHLSVRQIAAEAGVNHGLVHQYFGTKHELVTAAFDHINQRASLDINPDGFPPPDLATRRGGELGRALARMRLDDLGNRFTSHPVITSWKRALARQQPKLDEETTDQMIASAATLALGWAIFADPLCAALGVEPDRRSGLDDHIANLVTGLGGLPEAADSAAPQSADSDSSPRR